MIIIKYNACVHGMMTQNNVLQVKAATATMLSSFINFSLLFHNEVCVVTNEVCNLWGLQTHTCIAYSATGNEWVLTWLVLNTNLVPRVKLSVTIIKFLSEGLHTQYMYTL